MTGRSSWGLTLLPPLGYLSSPVFGFSLASYGPAILVTMGSLIGILLKYILDESSRRKTRDEWRRLGDKPAQNWEDLVEEKPQEKWTTAEYRILALKDLQNAVKREVAIERQAELEKVKEQVVEKVVEKVKEEVKKHEDT